MARNRYIVGLVFLTFFVMSLLTNILGPIVPDIITSFGVSLTAAALLPFSFFIAYGVMSIPAGFWVERFTEKPVMIAAFLAGTIGSLSFALSLPTTSRSGHCLSWVRAWRRCKLPSIRCCEWRAAKSTSHSIPHSHN